MCKCKLVQDSIDPSEHYRHFRCKKNVVITNEQCKMGWAKPHSPQEPASGKKITPDDLKSTLNQLFSHKSEPAPHITCNLLPFHTVILTDLSAASPRGMQGQSDACNSYRSSRHHLVAQKPLSEQKDRFSIFFSLQSPNVSELPGNAGFYSNHCESH